MFYTRYVDKWSRNGTTAILIGLTLVTLNLGVARTAKCQSAQPATPKSNVCATQLQAVAQSGDKILVRDQAGVVLKGRFMRSDSISLLLALPVGKGIERDTSLAFDHIKLIKLNHHDRQLCTAMTVVGAIGGVFGGMAVGRWVEPDNGTTWGPSSSDPASHFETIGGVAGGLVGAVVGWKIGEAMSSRIVITCF